MGLIEIHKQEMIFEALISPHGGCIQSYVRIASSVAFRVDLGRSRAHIGMPGLMRGRMAVNIAISTGGQRSLPRLPFGQQMLTNAGSEVRLD